VVDYRCLGSYSFLHASPEEDGAYRESSTLAPEYQTLAQQLETNFLFKRAEEKKPAEREVLRPYEY
jgi:hypothetical protein